MFLYNEKISNSTMLSYLMLKGLQKKQNPTWRDSARILYYSRKQTASGPCYSGNPPFCKHSTLNCLASGDGIEQTTIVGSSNFTPYSDFQMLY